MTKLRLAFGFAGILCGYAGVRAIVEGHRESGVLLLIMAAALLGAVWLVSRF
jgi:hypothetical protein